MMQINVVENRINEYISAVQAQLKDISSEEAVAILADLREHIDASLRTHHYPPTLESVETVLAEMDPPEAFAGGAEGTSEIVPRLSRLAIAGAVVLPFGILIALLMTIPVTYGTSVVVNGVELSSEPQVAWWQWLLRFTVIPLGIISPFATTWLGIAAIAQIRASKGRLIGKPLGFIAALFYPLLLLDGLLLFILFRIFTLIPEGNIGLTETLSLISLGLVILIDIIIAIVIWIKFR